MEPKREQLSQRIAVWVAGLSVASLCLFVVGCNQPESTSTQTSTTASPTPNSSSATFAPGVAGLQANPNPVPPSSPGKTTISWQTGTADSGDVYVVDQNGEKLFARGPSGSAEAPWITPGSTRFRLYRGTEHSEVLAELTVHMDQLTSTQSAPPALSPTP